MSNLGEMVEIDAKKLREDIDKVYYTMKELVDIINLAKATNLNPSYLSHRLKKGALPISVLEILCGVLGKKDSDYVEEYDLSDVPSYQMLRELRKRNYI